MQRYFMKEDYQEKDLYKVADENYHHIVRVMRMRSLLFSISK